MNDIKEFYKKYKKILVFLGLVILYFILLSAYKNNVLFTDEADNMLGAKTIANGGVIYKDFFSQHLPFMYYLLAPFSMLGLEAVRTLRLAGYLMLAILWACMYLRYSNKIGKATMFFYPLIYIFLIMNMSEINSMIVAEQFQTQFLVILLLEFILFYQNKVLKKSSQIIIGLSIFFATGIAFVSVIPIAVLVIFLFITDISEYIKKYKFSLGDYLKHFLKNYHSVLLWTIMPFLIFALSLCITGTLFACYEQAFYLNTEYYGSFNHYSSNPILTLVKTIPSLFISMKQFITICFTNFNMTGLIAFSTFLLFFGFAFSCVTNMRKHKILAFFFLIFALSCANRSFLDFHAIPCYGVCVIVILISLNNILNLKLVKILLAITVVFLFIPYSKWFIRILDPIMSTQSNYENIYRLTDKNDFVFYYNLRTYDYVDSNRKYASPVTTLVPWFQPLYEDKIIADLDKNQPKVIVYNPNEKVWDYIYRNFAPKLNQYIFEHYTYSPHVEIWIRNDYVQEAEQRLEIKIPNITNDYGNKEYMNCSLTTINQSFIATKEILDAIDLRFYTDNRQNNVPVTVKILNQNQEELTSICVDASLFVNNTIYHFDFADVNLVVGEVYHVIVEFTSNHENNYLFPYIVTTEQSHPYILKLEDSNYNLDMSLYYLTN